MPFRDDERAQSIQIGAILLFAVLIILFATYQAFIVPNQNRDVEANHVGTVTQQMQDLRNAIVSMPSTGEGRSITLTLGVEYPARVVAMNPTTPAGALRTLGTGPERVNLTVAHARATDREISDAWTGANRTYNTGALAYQPGYNEYQNPPTIVYENSLLYHSFQSSNLTRSGQQLIDGRSLTLLTLNGTLDVATSDSVSVDVDSVSASDRRITITNEATENVTIDIASRYDADRWEDELREDGEMLDQNQGGYVVDVTDSPIADSEFTAVHLELARGETYTLQMAKASVGTNVASEPVEYLVDVKGDRTTVQEGSTAQLIVEPRDSLNNPVSGVEVNATIEEAPQNGTLVNRTVESDADGRAVFEYESGEIDGASSRQFRVNFSYDIDPSTTFNASTPENVSVRVIVENTDGSGTGGGGGGGPYQIFWESTSNTGVTCDSASQPEHCVLDASQTSQLDVTAATSPNAESAPVSYAVNNSSVGSLDQYSSSTDTNGEDTRQFTAADNGTVGVFVSSGTSGDTIAIEVVNFGTGTGINPPVLTSMSVNDRSNPGQGPRFDVSWSVSDPDGDLSQVEVTMTEQTTSGGNTLDSETVAVSGSSDSDTTELGNNAANCGDEYVLEVTVTDDAGNTDSETRTATASC